MRGIAAEHGLGHEPRGQCAAKPRRSGRDGELDAAVEDVGPQGARRMPPLARHDPARHVQSH